MSHECRTKLCHTQATMNDPIETFSILHSHKQSISLQLVHEWSQKSDKTSGGINDHVDKYKVSSNKPQ